MRSLFLLLALFKMEHTRQHGEIVLNPQTSWHRTVQRYVVGLQYDFDGPTWRTPHRGVQTFGVPRSRRPDRAVEEYDAAIDLLMYVA